jgi:hypothetical protein
MRFHTPFNVIVLVIHYRQYGVSMNEGAAALARLEDVKALRPSAAPS